MTDLLTGRNSKIYSVITDWETSHNTDIESCTYSDLKEMQDTCMSKVKETVKFFAVINVIEACLAERALC